MTKIIVIAHQKGGVGKSTIASNLAVELSKQNTTSILDLDVQQSLTAFATARTAKLNQKLNILKAPSSTQELMDIIDNEKSDFLIIDTGGFDLDTQRISMYAADLIITPVSDSPMELHGLSVFSKTIAKLQEVKPSLKANILLNKVHQFASKSLDLLLNDIKDNAQMFDAFNTILRDRKDYKEAYFFGQSVCEYSSKNTACKEIIELIKEIKQKLSL
jgi:chromosome partitioning protein